MTDWKQILNELCSISGIAGQEAQVIEKITQIVAPWTDETRLNTLGSLIAIKRGVGPGHPRLMISTHIDEIGFVVSSLEGKGFVRIEPRGGIDPKVLPGQGLHIIGREGVVPAVVCTIPPHLLLEEERKCILPYEKLLLDTGLDEDSLNKKVKIGDPIVFEPYFKALGGKNIASKSLDNRASALASIKLLEALQRIKHQWDVCCVFSTQEEVGAKGAKTAAYELQPSCAIALDVTFGDQPEVQEPKAYPLGKAIPVGIGPNFSKPLQKLILSAAEKEGIAVTPEPMPYPRGTDAASIQTIREGIPTGLISIPLRFMHSPLEMVDENDINNAAKLLGAVIQKLDDEHREGFSWL